MFFSYSLRLITPIIIFFILMTSCDEEQVVMKNNVIEASSFIKNEKQASFETLGYSVKFVPLETRESCLLPGNAHIVYVSKADVFISDGKLLYRFGMDGTFKNTIGKIGNGPKEYRAIFGVSFNINKEEVYIYDGNNRITIWDIKGTSIGELNLMVNGYLSCVYKTTNGYWGEQQLYDNKDKDEINIIYIDSIGKLMGNRNMSKLDKLDNLSFHPYPIVKQNGDNYIYFNNYNFSCYVVNDSTRQFFKIELGKYSPDKNKLGNMDYRLEANSDFIEIQDIIYDEKNIFISMRNGQSLRGAIIDKSKGRLLYSEEILHPRIGGGIPLQNECDVKIWPQAQYNNFLYALCDINNLSTQEYEKLISEDVLNADIAEDQRNPLLVILSQE